jgi:hypothetical protein
MFPRVNGASPFLANETASKKIYETVRDFLSQFGESLSLVLTNMSKKRQKSNGNDWFTCWCRDRDAQKLLTPEPPRKIKTQKGYSVEKLQLMVWEDYRERKVERELILAQALPTSVVVPCVQDILMDTPSKVTLATSPIAITPKLKSVHTPKTKKAKQTYNVLHFGPSVDFYSNDGRKIFGEKTTRKRVLFST